MQNTGQRPAAGAPATHVLDSPADQFRAVLSGDKRHKVRRRGNPDFRVGDLLLLRETGGTGSGLTGREALVRITYLTSAENQCALSPEGLDPDWSILSIEPAGDAVAA